MISLLNYKWCLYSRQFLFKSLIFEFYCLDDEPSLAKIRNIAKDFLKALLTPNENDVNFVENAERIGQEIRSEADKNIAKLYINAIKKVNAKGLEYVSSERKRLKGLLEEGNLSNEKKVNFQKRLDVLKEFKIIIEDVESGDE